MIDLEVRYIIRDMLYFEGNTPAGMIGQQVLVYINSEGKEIIQTIDDVRWCEDNEIENPKYRYEMPAEPEKFKVIKKLNPASPYPVWTTHKEGGICIHPKGRSEGCILIDTATRLGKSMYDDLIDRLYNKNETLNGEISLVVDKRRKQDINRFPVYYVNNPNYKQEPT